MAEFNDDNLVKLDWGNQLWCGDTIKCPYCGKESDSIDVEEFTSSGVVECPECGHMYVALTDYQPEVTTYRYKGRSDRKTVYRDSKNPVYCGLCGSRLEVPPDEDILFGKFPMCPICDTVVCNKCEKERKPCCDEYRAWVKREEKFEQRIRELDEEDKNEEYGYWA